MRGLNPYVTGAALGLILFALRALAPDLTVPPNLTCAVRSADGCMVWADQRRIDRYKAGKAGQ